MAGEVPDGLIEAGHARIFDDVKKTGVKALVVFDGTGVRPRRAERMRKYLFERALGELWRQAPRSADDVTPHARMQLIEQIEQRVPGQPARAAPQRGFRAVRQAGVLQAGKSDRELLVHVNKTLFLETHAALYDQVSEEA